ncbi:MAG: MerR family DNA-binding transcriptional regulator, partial [Lachnospiraceae bacterium]|nr:MerR family DNA-binding transcriptional regulator [Lachnospiraceae bacterium]
MTISEVSKKYGISQDTLRYYERIGVIPPVQKKGWCAPTKRNA